MSPETIITSGMIVGGFVVVLFISVGVQDLANKIFKTNYVTCEDCLKHREALQSRQDSNLNDMKQDISMIKQLLLILAAKAGVDDTDLKRLVE